jgi:hypothetical protein
VLGGDLPALVAENPDRTEEAMSEDTLGVLCRCGGRGLHNCTLGGAMSETPQEILDRAAPIWDKHVVSFTLVLATLRATLAENKRLASMCCVCEGDCCNGKRKAEARLREVEAENEAYKSYEPCPKCGYGVTASCYGCRLKAAKAELAGAKDAWQKDVDGLEAEHAALKARVEAVLALHVKAYEPHCEAEPVWCKACQEEYPCPTRRALEGKP